MEWGVFLVLRHAVQIVDGTAQLPSGVPHPAGSVLSAGGLIWSRDMSRSNRRCSLGLRSMATSSKPGAWSVGVAPVYAPQTMRADQYGGGSVGGIEALDEADVPLYVVGQGRVSLPATPELGIMLAIAEYEAEHSEEDFTL